MLFKTEFYIQNSLFFLPLHKLTKITAYVPKNFFSIFGFIFKYSA